MPRPTPASSVMPIDWSTRPSSSMARQSEVNGPSSGARPAPPYSSGATRPNRPRSPICCTTSVGKWWSLSHFATCGAIAVSAKSRTVRRNSSCSRDSSNDVMDRIVTREVNDC